MNKTIKITIISLVTIFSGLTIYFMILNFNPKSDIEIRDLRRKTDIKLLQAAIEEYYFDYAVYPESKTGRVIACDGPCIWGQAWEYGGKTYMKRIPHDPLASSSYLYTFNELNNSYTLEACMENLTDKTLEKTDYTIWCNSGLVYKVGSK